MESWLSLTNAPSRVVVGLCENLSARDSVIAWRSRIMWNWLRLRRAHDCAKHTYTRKKRQQGDVIQSDPEQSVFLASGLANPLKASFTQITKSTFLSCLQNRLESSPFSESIAKVIFYYSYRSPLNASHTSKRAAPNRRQLGSEVICHIPLYLSGCICKSFGAS